MNKKLLKFSTFKGFDVGDYVVCIMDYKGYDHGNNINLIKDKVYQVENKSGNFICVDGFYWDSYRFRKATEEDIIRYDMDNYNL